MDVSIHRKIAAVLSLLAILSTLAACSEPLSEEQLQRSREIPPWFDDAKLGIFIHWGPASVPAFAPGKALEPGELEQVLLHSGGRQELPYAEWYLYALSLPDSSTRRYHAEYYGDAPYDDFARQFEQRVADNWSADQWAQLFEQSGARYVVLVTKHHDGFTLWPSAVANPHREDWSSEQDMVGELARAVRARGMRFGTYYSTGLDWSFRLVSDGELVRNVMRSAPASQEYADYVFAHMRELINRYEPDVLWADIGYPSRGRLDDLFAHYFSEVPDGVVNDRWNSVDVLGQIAELPGATPVMQWLGRVLTDMAGDSLTDDPARIGYKTAEYDSLPTIAPFKWESTRGLGGSFAYNAAETAADMLTAEELVHFVADSAAKNGNVLINVGPDSYGRIPDIQQAPLRGLGDWLQTNGEAIYGTRPWNRYRNNSGRELRYTRNENSLYAIVYGDVGSEFAVEDPGVEWAGVSVLGAQVESVQRDGQSVHITLAEPLRGSAAVVRYQR